MSKLEDIIKKNTPKKTPTDVPDNTEVQETPVPQVTQDTQDKPVAENTQTVLPEQTVENKTIMEQYVDSVYKLTDTPKEFIEASAYYMFSTLYGQFFTNPFLYDERQNLMIILSSKPARSRRSTLLKFPKFIIKEVMRDFFLRTVKLVKEDIEVEETEEEVEEESDRERKERKVNKIMEDYFLCDDGSLQGFMDTIDALHRLGCRCCTIINPEIGLFFDNMGRASSSAYGIPTIISNLYSGEEHTENFTRRGKDGNDVKKTKRHIPAGMYFTMFGSMQEPELYIRAINIKQGMMRRIIEIIKKMYTRFLPPLDRTRVGWEQNFRVLLPPLIEKMKDFESRDKMFATQHYRDMPKEDRERKHIEVSFDPRSFAEYNKREEDETMEIDESPETSLYDRWRISDTYQIGKLAVMHAIDENSFDDKGKYGLPGSLLVTIKHWNKAKDYIDRTIEEGGINRRKELCDKLESKDEPILVSSPLINKVEKIINDYWKKNKQPIPHSVALPLSGMKAPAFLEIIETIKQSGKIERISVDGTTYGCYKPILST